MKSQAIAFRCPRDLLEKLDYLCSVHDPESGSVDRSTVLRSLIEMAFEADQFQRQLEFEMMLHRHGRGPNPLASESEVKL